MSKKSKCTVGFLVSAAQMAYKIGRNNHVDAQEIEDNSYSIERSIAPIGSHGTGDLLWLQYILNRRILMCQLSSQFVNYIS